MVYNKWVRNVYSEGLGEDSVNTERSAVVARAVRDGEVGGSSPPAPTGVIPFLLLNAKVDVDLVADDAENAVINWDYLESVVAFSNLEGVLNEGDKVSMAGKNIKFALFVKRSN